MGRWAVSSREQIRCYYQSYGPNLHNHTAIRPDLCHYADLALLRSYALTDLEVRLTAHLPISPSARRLLYRFLNHPPRLFRRGFRDRRSRLAEGGLNRLPRLEQIRPGTIARVLVERLLPQLQLVLEVLEVLEVLTFERELRFACFESRSARVDLAPPRFHRRQQAVQRPLGVRHAPLGLRQHVFRNAQPARDRQTVGPARHALE